MTQKAQNQDNLHFLTLQDYHLSKKKAVNAVIAKLKECEIKRPELGWDSFSLKWNDENVPVLFADLVAEMRGTGTIRKLQEWLDNQDSVFGHTIKELATPNHEMKWTCHYAGWSKEARGPFRTSCVEFELMEDILDFRRHTCEHSNEHEFRLTSRYYRAYLSACVSLIDAFINRHILMAEHDGFTTPEFDELKRATNMDDRIRLWFAVCSVEDPAAFLASTEWCHFQEIRKRRNEILHAVEPISVYAMSDLQLYLNKVRTGIGGLLLWLRRANQKPTLLFIERLRTAPLVDFHQIRFKTDGNHQIKRIQGK